VIKAMFRSGALGYVSKSSLFSELVDGIIAVASGETFVSRSIAERLGKSSVSLLTADQQALSPSEEAVVRFIAEGLSNKEAASELGISARTVEKHRKSSMDKLEVKTVPALVKLAMKLGLISRD
jgi:two-component system, NarL family, response regulator NreC